MSSITLDKYAEQITAMRDRAEAQEPGLSSRLQVYSLTGQETTLHPDSTFPGLNNLQIGAHFHMPNDQGEHTQEQSATWPQCIIVQ